MIYPRILKTRSSKQYSKVKQYIDNNLNPRNKIFLIYSNFFFEEVPSIKIILEELDITEEEYYNARKVSGD